ncbi:DUF72 domain-containing protein [Kineococcus sp. SYSU DK005]|uniref:DUF72 domain-containing protein n=1 Tax=Kineococcus sp. SYSU DK005 TaxID=3383126 RepID=UPI003D7F12E3
MGSVGHVRVGTSGWTYPEWRGVFYPPGLPRGAELEHAAARVATLELNASFYALQRPGSYLSWSRRTPPGFCFSVKGWRAVTHERRLAGARQALAAFFASGVLHLGDRLGPVLWQLPPSLRFEPERLAAFCALLPRTTTAAAELAASLPAGPGGGAATAGGAPDSGAQSAPDDGADGAGAPVERPLRHALEVRHPSHARAELVELLRAHDVALVTADSAGRWPLLLDQTAGFSYVRLHGSPELYVSGYDDAALDAWALRVRAWAAGGTPPGARLLAPPDPPAPPGGRDVFVYLDNTAAARAPFDAAALAQRLA